MKSEDGGHGPGQDTRSPARKLRQRFAPGVESPFERAAVVQQCIKRPSESCGTGAALHGIAQRHLFEGEQEVGARFYAHRPPRDFQRISVKQPQEHGLRQFLLPLKMGLPLVVAFPRQIVGVAEGLGEIAVELVAATRERAKAVHGTLGACAARPAFGFWTLQVRILAAWQRGFVALADPARGLGLGQPLPRAAGVQPFDLCCFRGTRGLLLGHEKPTAWLAPGCPQQGRRSPGCPSYEIGR